MIERRRAVRESVETGGTLFFAPRRELLNCAALDYSDKGVKLALDRLYALPQSFLLSFDGLRTACNCRLIWSRRNFVGIQFQNASTPRLTI